MSNCVDVKQGHMSVIDAHLHSLRRLQSRVTGSPSHRKLIEQIAAELSELGLPVARDEHRFTRWLVPGKDHLQLFIGGQAVEVASAYPYSGATGAAGVSGRLVRVRGGWRDWARARGGIAVLEVPHITFAADLLVATWSGRGPSGLAQAPLLSAMISGPNLRKAREAGVQAVVAVWRGLTAGNAKGQYVPFTFPFQDVPALWLAGEAGKQVLEAADRGDEARLVLDAALEHNVSTETIWAVSPGRNEAETLLVVTHTDGVNLVEENGHIALLALAREAVAAPHERTLVFVFTTGHLRIPAVTSRGQATTAWLEAHPEYWQGGPGQARAVAALAIEHLGAMEFVEDGAGGYGPSGRPEPELLYATTAELNDLICREWKGPDSTEFLAFRPGALIHFGEGEPMFRERIPSIALVSAPQYLLAEIDSEVVDIAVLQRQLANFFRLLHRLDVMPRAAIGVVRVPTFLEKLIAFGRIILALSHLEWRQTWDALTYIWALRSGASRLK